MVTKEGSKKSVNSMIQRIRIVMLGCGHIGENIVKMFNFFENLPSYSLTWKVILSKELVTPKVFDEG